MEENSTHKSVLDQLSRLLRHMFVYLPPIIGFLLIIATGKGWIFPCDRAWNKVFETVGVVFVTGGLLSLAFSVLKYFKYFQNILSDILYGHEFLERRTDLPSLWSNISSILYHRKYPKIAKKIQTLLKDNYFDTKNPYYSSYAELKTTYLQDKDNWFKVTDVIKQKIIATSESEFKIPMATDVEFEEGKPDGYYCKLLTLIVNDSEIYNYLDGNEKKEMKDENEKKDEKGNLIINKAGVSLVIETQNSKNIMALKYDLTLSGKTEYSIVRVTEKRYDITFNPLKRWIASHIYRRLVVYVSYPENVLYLCPKGSGTINDFKPVITGHLCNLQLEYNDILLPQQGIVFGVAKKN